MKLLLLLLFSLSFYCMYTIRCTNSRGCYCPSFPCGQYGGSCRCLCENGCKIENNVCINASHSIPTLKIIIRACDDPNNGACGYYINATYCPIGCTYYHNQCWNQTSSDICYPHSEWRCPIGCKYDATKHQCNPLYPTSICQLINSTMTCPNGCIYNYNLNRCISGDQNVICGLEYGLVCPKYCKINPRGDTCIPETTNNICNQSDEPICTFGCKLGNGNCVMANEPTVPWSCEYGYTRLCEPFVNVNCPKGVYIYNNNEIYRSCDLRYPLRLKYKYSNVTCKYSDDSYCNSNIYTQTCCNNQ